jgi:hypothetical protein
MGVIYVVLYKVARGGRREVGGEQHQLQTGTSTVKRMTYSRSCLAHIEVVDESDGSAMNARAKRRR